MICLKKQSKRLYRYNLFRIFCIFVVFIMNQVPYIYEVSEYKKSTGCMAEFTAIV